MLKNYILLKEVDIALKNKQTKRTPLAVKILPQDHSPAHPVTFTVSVWTIARLHAAATWLKWLCVQPIQGSLNGEMLPSRETMQVKQTNKQTKIKTSPDREWASIYQSKHFHFFLTALVHFQSPPLLIVIGKPHSTLYKCIWLSCAEWIMKKYLPTGHVPRKALLSSKNTYTCFYSDFFIL